MKRSRERGVAYVETAIAVATVVTLGASALAMTRDATTETSGREGVCIASDFQNCDLGTPRPALGFDPIPPAWGAPGLVVAPPIDLPGIAPGKFKYTKAKCLCSGDPSCSGVVEVEIDPPSKDHDTCTEFVKRACAACTAAGCQSTAKGCS